MSAVRIGLGVLRFQLQIGRIQIMAVIALATAVFCSPLLVHGEEREALPFLADLVFAGFIIAAPLLVHGAEPCLRGLPISPASQRLCGYLAMLLISWLGLLAAVLQIPFGTDALRAQGWPTLVACIGEACTAPFWIVLMLPIAAALRHRLRLVVIAAALVALLVLPSQGLLIVKVHTDLMQPARWLGLHDLGQGVLLGAYGVLVAVVLAVVPRGVAPGLGGRLLAPHPGGWSGRLHGAWEALIAQHAARVLAPLGAQTRLVVLVLIDSTLFWIVMAGLVLIAYLGQQSPHQAVRPGIPFRALPFIMAAALAGAGYVTVMTRRLCLQAFLSRNAGLAVAVASGPVLILIACAALFVWRPLVIEPPAIEPRLQPYFAAVFPRASSVVLPSGATMSVDDYCLRLMAKHVGIDPGFLRAQRLASWRIAAHCADQLVPEQLLHADTRSDPSSRSIWIVAGPKAWRPPRDSQFIARYVTRAQWQLMMSIQPQRLMEDVMVGTSRQLALLWSAAAGVAFMLVLALVMPGRGRSVLGAWPKMLPATSAARFLTWAQLNGALLMLASVLVVAWPAGPIPISADLTVPPLPMPVLDRVMIWATSHGPGALAILAVGALPAVAWLRHAIRSLPLR